MTPLDDDDRRADREDEAARELERLCQPIAVLLVTDCDTIYDRLSDLIERVNWAGHD